MFSPRTLRILLALSVTVNLAVIGIVAGAILRDPPRPDPDRGPAFGAYDRALSESDRRALRESFRRAAPDFREGWRAMQSDTQDLITALRTSPYDPAQVGMIFDRQHQRGERMMTLGLTLMQERLSAMSDDERAEFAARLERHSRKERDPRP